MKKFILLCTDRTEVEINAPTERAAHYEAQLAAQSVGKSVYSIRPEGCTGLSPTVHLGRLCPVHHGVTLRPAGRG